MALPVFSRNDQFGEGDANSTQRKFTIEFIAPVSGYTTEFTPVAILGRFKCDDLDDDPSKSAWSAMFGDTEVPVEIFQRGSGGACVFTCKAPPHGPGKVNVCVTCCNRVPCCEIREFEYLPIPVHVFRNIREDKKRRELFSLKQQVLEKFKLRKWILSKRGSSLSKEEHKVIHC